MFAAYDAVVARYANDPGPAVCLKVAQTLIGKAHTLDNFGRFDEADAAFDAAVARYGDASDPALRDLVAASWSTRAWRERSWGGPWRRSQSMTMSWRVTPTIPSRDSA